MSPWKTVGSVVAGAVVTVVLGFSTLALLPFLGFATAEVVGNWLPIQVFAVPLAMCPTAGGAITGFLHGDDRKRGAMLGGLAAAIGVAVVGVVLGLAFLVLMVGMIPAHGGEPDFSTAALWMGTIGGAVGFVSGAVFGAIGGVTGHVGRTGLDSRDATEPVSPESGDGK